MGRKDPQCSDKSAKSSKKGHSFPLFSQKPATPPAFPPPQALASPAPSRAAGARGRTQHHAEGTHTIRALLQLRACERRATQTNGQRKKYHPIISHNVVARDAAPAVKAAVVRGGSLTAPHERSTYIQGNELEKGGVGEATTTTDCRIRKFLRTARKG
jgi:hypothetical protein